MTTALRRVAHISALRPMEDSVNPGAIPVTEPIVAGYVLPSRFAWKQSDWDRFTNSIKIRITPSASVTGVGIQVLDVETGDATAAQAPGWAVAQRKLGQIPTIYCSGSLWQSVQNAFNAAGVAQPLYWIAAYPGGGQVLPILNGITAIAHQYADPPASGGDYDVSVVASYWPGVDGGMMSDFDTVVPVKDANGNVITNVSYGWMLINLYSKNFWAGGTPPWDGPSMYQLMKDTSAKLDALATTLSADEVALLAAIKAEPAVTVDATALAGALETAGLPQQLVSAFVAVLAKATSATPTT
jgi:hypothetical protein